MWVKVCGTTSESDALLAVALGADAVGFIFAPSSRQIAPVVAADIVRRLPPEVLTVGVFRDEAPTRVCGIVHRVGLGAAQLHGHETATDTRYIRERVPVVMKAFTAGDPAVARSGGYGADMVLLDSARPGGGEVFDWTLVDGVPDGTRLVLAGGLNADNVTRAIETARPWGVDVATGVESAPGQKDAAKLRAFIEAARAAGEQFEQEKPDRGSGALYDWEGDE
jgi:phosphoribosylanthranilate isomerase